MSFILDALKKSESERQQSNAAEFTGVTSSPGRPSMPRWLLLLGFLLAINLAVLIGILLRSSEPAPHVGSATSNDQPLTEPVRPISFEEQVAAARQKPPEVQPPTTSDQAVPERLPGVQADLISQNPSTVTSKQLYPTIQEVRVSGAINLPELHLDIHVFSPVPEDRFVFINMTKLREGSQMEEGPRVVEIAPDGVILRYQDRSFVLPRE